MNNQQQATYQSRLGLILVKRCYISLAQLDKALIYQTKRRIKLGTALVELNLISRKQLNLGLRRQSWTRNITACVALFCTPFSTAFASDQVKESRSVKSTSVAHNIVENNKSSLFFTNNAYFSSLQIDQEVKGYYYSGNNQFKFDVKHSFSDTNSVQSSLISNRSNNVGIGTSAGFDLTPQVSLIKTSFQKTNIPYTGTYKHLNHYRNSKPIVYMLTLKGRSLVEKSGNQMTLWSLNHAREGVQKNAQVMFSITKRF